MMIREITRNKIEKSQDTVPLSKSGPEIHPPGELAGAIEIIKIVIGIIHRAKRFQDSYVVALTKRSITETRINDMDVLKKVLATTSKLHKGSSA